MELQITQIEPLYFENEKGDKKEGYGFTFTLAADKTLYKEVMAKMKEWRINVQLKK